MSATAAPPDIGNLIREIEAHLSHQTPLFFTLYGVGNADIKSTSLARLPAIQLRFLLHTDPNFTAPERLVLGIVEPETLFFDMYKSVFVPTEHNGLHYGRVRVISNDDRTRIRGRKESCQTMLENIQAISPASQAQSPLSLDSNEYLLRSMSTGAYSPRSIDVQLAKRFVEGWYQVVMDRRNNQQAYLRGMSNVLTDKGDIADGFKQTRDAYEHGSKQCRETLRNLSTELLVYLLDRIPEEHLGQFLPLDRNRVKKEHQRLDTLL